MTYLQQKGILKRSFNKRLRLTRMNVNRVAIDLYAFSRKSCTVLRKPLTLLRLRLEERFFAHCTTLVKWTRRPQFRRPNRYGREDPTSVLCVRFLERGASLQ